MLTSSDAKWRCMWHMLVWSINLTLVSQFLDLADHIAFYIFGTLSVIVLPILTSVYSNTSGRHGAELLRVGYVICDPVLSCVSITPILLLNHLPSLVSEYFCYKLSDTWNETHACLWNMTDIKNPPPYEEPPASWELVLTEKRMKFLVIEASIVIPILVALLMGKRTPKMHINTFVLNFAYWFIVAIEAADLIETALLGDQYKHIIYTSEAIVSIMMIFTNSYAVVTLCSYITPGTSPDVKSNRRRFDFVYKVFMGASGVFFTEVPLLVARFNILAADMVRFLPGTFYFWLIKDVLAIMLLCGMVLVQKLGKKYIHIPCAPIKSFDTQNVLFQPEKRDVYIEKQKKVRFQDPPATEFCERRSEVAETAVAMEMTSLLDTGAVATETKDVRQKSVAVGESERQKGKGGVVDVAEVNTETNCQSEGAPNEDARKKSRKRGGEV